MAQLIVRNVDDRVAAALKLRAASNGRSAEAEHREILRRALVDDDEFKRLLASMPLPPDDDDSAFVRVQDLGRDVAL